MLDIENKHRVLENKNGEGFTHQGDAWKHLLPPGDALFFVNFSQGE
jgi:hypothetical protein